MATPQAPFTVVGPNNTTFKTDGPAWVLRNSKMVMYWAVIAFVIVSIIVFLYQQGRLDYKSADKASAPNRSILGKSDSGSSQSKGESYNKSRSSKENASDKGDKIDKGDKKVKFENMEKDIDDINNSQE